jgi:hypothetical protein
VKIIHSVKLRFFPFGFSFGFSRQEGDNYIQAGLRSRAVVGTPSSVNIISVAGNGCATPNINKTGGQCAYNVTLRRVQATVVAVVEQ